jgi:invasion protein IalB
VLRSLRLGTSVASAIFALALMGGTVSAQQQKAPDAKKEAAPATAKKKVEKKAASPCAGLEETACKANTACSWYREVTTKKGQKRKAHCQKKPTPPPAKKK